MDWLKRNFWLVNVLTIAACSTSLAWAAGHVIESKLLDPPAKRATLIKPTAPTATRQKDVDAILKRNAFCSACPPLIDVGPTPGSDSSGSNDPTRTSQPLQLVTVLVSDDSRWSLCILRETGSKQTGAFKLGSVLPSGWTVVAIQDTPRPRVEIALESKIEFLEFDLPSKAGDGAVATADTPPAPPSDDNYDAGIKKVNDGRYTIQRDLLNKLLSDTNSIARMARIVPAPNGSGFRLYAVRPGSFFDKIGLKNGDILRAVNGNEMSSPDRALEIYSKLRSASHVNVSIQRGGKDQSMDYTITG